MIREMIIFAGGFTAGLVALWLPILVIAHRIRSLERKGVIHPGEMW